MGGIGAGAALENFSKAFILCDIKDETPVFFGKVIDPDPDNWWWWWAIAVGESDDGLSKAGSDVRGVILPLVDAVSLSRGLVTGRSLGKAEGDSCTFCL